MVDTAVFSDLYPFESHYLDIGGLRYHYLDEGGGEAGDTAVVMVHGNPTWSFHFRKLIPEVSRKYRVIVPDHIGCGLSDKPQDYEYTLAKHIDNLDCLVTHLGLKKIIFLMHDWGGAIGMGCALRHPGNTAGFVVLNTAAFYVDRVPKRIRMCRIPGLGALMVRGFNGFCLAAFLFATSKRRRFTRQVRAGYLAPYNNWKNRIAIHRFVQDIPLQKNHPARATIEEIGAGLAQFREKPMLIFWGADDFCFTESHFLPMWKERFPDAEVNVIQDAGHYVIEDAHEEILPRLLAFLEEAGG
jgi:cis-3-alkyl-4-acyloxetan-2-one decarboxylase